MVSIRCGSRYTFEKVVRVRSYSIFNDLTQQEAQSDLNNLFQDIHTEVNADYVASTCDPPHACVKSFVDEQHKSFHGPITRSWSFWFKLVSYRWMHCEYKMVATCSASAN